MRTTQKQFPENWLTYGWLAFTIQRAKARWRQQIKRRLHKWRDDVELINWPSLTKNLPYKLLKTSTQKGPLQATVEIG